MHENERDSDNMCVQMRELCEWRDRCELNLHEKGECKPIIDFFCTD